MLTRGYLANTGDNGELLTVAGRLLAGDALYRNVYDNKDPLFYYSQAFALWAFGWQGPSLMDIAWLVVASVSAHLLLRAMTDDLVVAVLGQLLYPLLLTGLNYYAGLSEIPGLSLLPLFAYLVYTRKFNFAGIVAAAVLLLKLNLLPVVAAIAVVGLYLAPDRPARLRRGVSLIGSTVAGVSVVFLVLAARGEFLGYLANIRQNLNYSSTELSVDGWPSGVHGHVLVVYHYMPRAAGAIILTLFAFFALVMLGGPVGRQRLHRLPLTHLTVASALGTAVVLGSSASWDHHLLFLAFPMLCGSCLALQCARKGLLGSRWRRLKLRGAAIPAGCALVLIGSLAMDPPSRANVLTWRDAPDTTASDALMTAANEARLSRPVSYFHLGANDEDGAGAFLGRSFQLSCPQFEQYTYDSPAMFQNTLRCLREKRPSLIAVTSTFALTPWDIAGTPPWAWTTFVRAGQEYLNSQCSNAVERTDVGGVAAPGETADVRVYRCR